MPYLMQIGFDNDRRLNRKKYLFEYKGIKFKLVQRNPQEWADALITIIPDRDIDNRERIFSIASEFLSALSWRNKSRVMVWESGLRSCGEEYSINRALPWVFSYPRIPYAGSAIGFGISTIPKVETEEQRIALTLLRESRASNNNYLSFLFYWQILEIGGTNAEGYVNKIYRKKPRNLWLDRRYINRLPLNGRSLGVYLQDDCRHAIAHIRRNPGKKKLELDKIEERKRLSISVRVVSTIAEYYVEDKLGLTKQLYLIRKTKRGFPIYVDEEYIESNVFYQT